MLQWRQEVIHMKLRKLLSLTALALTVLLAATPAFAAETVHLTLKIEGQVVKGESTQASLGRADTIECVSLEQAVQGGEKVQHSPLKCVKRVDKSSPLLIRALIERQKVEALFKFYRPNPTGDGTTEQFYTIELKNARITGYRMWVPNTIDPASSNNPPLEEVTFSFQAIAFTYVNGGIAYSSDGSSGSVKGRQEADSWQSSGQSADPGLKAQVKDKGVTISWNAVTPPQGKQLAGYNVYRSTDPNQLFVAANRINDFPISATTISDVVKTGTYYYGLQAVWGDQTTTEYSNPAKAEVK
jgi:type VI secretion system secreted protein Hcp